MTKPVIFPVKRIIEWKHFDGLLIFLTFSNAVVALGGVGVDPAALSWNYFIQLILFVFLAMKHVKRAPKTEGKQKTKLSANGMRVHGYWSGQQ